MSAGENDVETAVVPRLESDAVSSDTTAETVQPPPRPAQAGVTRVILIGVAVMLASTALTIAIIYALR